MIASAPAAKLNLKPGMVWSAMRFRPKK